MFYWIVLSGAWVIWHLAFRIKVVGRENMIHDRGFVMVCNHVFALDPVFLVLARYYGKRMVIMGKEELFEIHPLLTWFLKKVNVIPVHRGKGDTGVVERAIEDVKRGHGPADFPGGNALKRRNIGPLKKRGIRCSRCGWGGYAAVPYYLSGRKAQAAGPRDDCHRKAD